MPTILEVDAGGAGAAAGLSDTETPKSRISQPLLRARAGFAVPDVAGTPCWPAERAKACI